jgi:hypothetical protein
MREKHLARGSRFEETRSEETHGEAYDRFILEEGAERDAAPRPSELVFEIGLALAGFLSLAVFANLFVVAIHAS